VLLLYFDNEVYSNITKGPHVKIFVFKELDEIEVLSI
jgi:hypothetical protein